MVQQLGSPPDLPPRHHVDLFPTPYAGDVTSEVTAQRALRSHGAEGAKRTKVPPVRGPKQTEPARAANQAQATLAQATPAQQKQPVRPLRPLRGVRTHVVRQVAVLEVGGRLSDVVEELDHAVQLALAEDHRGVVCDLSMLLDADAEATEVLASIGRHVRDWPGLAVAVACRDARLGGLLRAHPVGGHLTLATSLFSAMSAVLATPTLTVQSLRLAPHPSAPRAAREFVTRTLLDWRLARVIPFASLVVSELVASATVNAETGIEVSVVWNEGAIRLTVRDFGPMLPVEHPTLRGRGLTVVAGLSRAFGVLPTAEGGKVVWAVLEAARPGPSTRRIRTERATPTQESPIFTDACGLAGLPFCAGAGPDSR
jgi:hypothetical protein